MDSFTANVHYWLVKHPWVSGFEWKEGETWGASPEFLFTTVFTYLFLTLVLYYYIVHMSKSKVNGASSQLPTFLRRISTLHNIILLLLSFIMALGCGLSATSQMPLKWVFCFPRDKPAYGPVFFWGYVFYLSKILEFIDTLLILLSKDTRRLTFLHVYHHAAVIVLCYLWLHSRQSLFAIALSFNSTVHTVMYTYYLMCTLGMKPRWKKAVTDFQLFQFLMGIPFSVPMWWLHFTGEGCSGIWSWLYHCVFVVSLYLLFSSFHTRNYGNTKNKKKV